MECQTLLSNYKYNKEKSDLAETFQGIQSSSIVPKRLKLKSIMCNFALKNVSPERVCNKITSGRI